MSIEQYDISLDSKNPSKIVLGSGFKSDTIELSGANIHYVLGGSGPAIIFVHGFSEDWYEFSKVMSLLAWDFTTIAIDLRGIGKSQVKQEAYDAESQAQDIHELLAKLNITNPYIVGHDMGAMIAYAYARLYPQEIRGVALLDGPLPGTRSTGIMVHLPIMWHFTFHRIAKLPEKLISHREYAYFKKAFFKRFAKNEHALSDTVMRHYADAYTKPEQLRAGLGLYRAYRMNRKFMRNHLDALHVPILLLEGHYFSDKPSPLAKELSTSFGCLEVNARVVKDCGHFMAIEQPTAIANILHNHASS